MEQFEVNTIAAISTPAGVGGIAVIRVSGPDAIKIVDSAWSGKSLAEAASHTAHLGKYVATDGNILDEAVATIFRAPASFTREDTVEISVHGSRWIQREVLSDLIRRGARAANPGEFTQRAFLNGKLDLAQAEGIADLISSSSRAAHDLALSQTRGHFSRELEALRGKLVEFASLLELELDFSEEDVEFADRTNLLSLANTILMKVKRLASSYSSGAAIKEGVPVVIAGVPNAGKSSLLNLLLGDDKAIVSDIPGTTRDTIEDTLEIDGVLYRFIDTAGLRATSDVVENLGIERARSKMQDARIVIWIIDPTSPLPYQYDELNSFLAAKPDAKVITLLNKSDLQSPNPDAPTPNTQQSADESCTREAVQVPEQSASELTNQSGSETNPRGAVHVLAQSASELTNQSGSETDPLGAVHVLAQSASELPSPSADELPSQIKFSAKTGLGLDKLKTCLNDLTFGDINPDAELIVTNARHYEALTRGADALTRAIEGIETGLSADFIAQDVREALHHLGTITGTITTDNLLHSIFSSFCIGK